MKKLFILFVVSIILYTTTLNAQSYLDSVTTTSEGKFCPGGTITFNVFFRNLGGPPAHLEVNNWSAISYSDTVPLTWTTYVLDMIDTGDIIFYLTDSTGNTTTATVHLTVVGDVASGVVSNPFGRGAKICLSERQSIFISTGSSSTGYWSYNLGGGGWINEFATSDTLTVHFGTTPAVLMAQRIDTATCPTGGHPTSISNIDSVFITGPTSNRLDSLNDSTIQTHFPIGTPNTMHSLYRDGVWYRDSMERISGSFITFKHLPPGTYWVIMTDTLTGCSIEAGDTINLLSSGFFAALPVSLTDFHIENQKGIPLLSWETKTEQNNDKFIIERSFDGQNFESIGQVAGAGNSHITLSYQFPDQTLSDYIGDIYYRLSQVDKDGAQAELGIRAIKLFGSTDSLTKYYMTILGQYDPNSQLILKSDGTKQFQKK